jgi:hypothetical protein
MPAMPQFGLTSLDKNIMSADPYWIVEATFDGDEGNHGAATFGHCRSLEEAQAQLARKLSGADDSRDLRYTDWVIVEYTPTIVGRVVHREPVREPVATGGVEE